MMQATAKVLVVTRVEVEAQLKTATITTQSLTPLLRMKKPKSGFKA